MLINILRPLAYLTIRHPSRLPALVNWFLPALIAGIAVFATGALVKTSIDVWGATGVVNRLLGFIQNLPGFYIAALAAIATFGGDALQKTMPGTPPTMSIPHNGGTLNKVALTRRLFLSSMFAYLTALSLLLTLSAIAGLALAEPVKNVIAPSVYPVIKAAVDLPPIPVPV